MKIGLIDIETSPNTAHVWGLFQQNVSIKQLLDSSYTMCFAWKWYEKSKLEFRSVFEHGEQDMLDHAWYLLNEADAVIHYNGSKFDIPTLQKEFLLHGMGPPAPAKEIDLLKTVRKQFRFPSKKLDYVARVLGIEGKVEHMGHELWIRCMNDDPKAWNLMKKYNKQDVVMLEEVYDQLRPWITDHPNFGLYGASDRPVCTNCGSSRLQSRGMAHTKTQSYRRFQCLDCLTWQRSRVNMTQGKENILTQV